MVEPLLSLPLLSLPPSLRERCLSVGASGARRLPSEEAEVWRLERPHSTPLWLKRHRHHAKAQREEGVYLSLEPLRERLSPYLRAPQLLEGPRSHPERPCELLFTHLEGELVGLKGSLSSSETSALARGLYALHSAPLASPHDPLPLTQALPKRLKHTLEQGDKLREHLNALPLSSNEHTETLRGLTVLTRFTSERCEALERRFGLLSLLGGRVLCHRDLHAHNLTFLHEPEGRCSLGLLDWGQARFDWWGAEWATLACRLSPVSFQEGWEAYQALLALPREARPALQESVGCLALNYAFSTLLWGGRHQDEQVMSRGVEELRCALSLSRSLSA